MCEKSLHLTSQAFNDQLNGPLAHRAEVAGPVIPHSAIRRWSINTFEAVASPLVCSHLSARAADPLHVFPFGLDIDEGGYVRLPRLNVLRIHGRRVSLIGVLVGEPGESVSKLMDYDEIGRASCRERV